MSFSIEVDTGTEEIAFLKEAEVEALAPFFFRGSKYRNFLPFAYFDNRGKETVVHGYAGVMKNTEDDVYECLYNVELPEKCDVYICPTFSNLQRHAQTKIWLQSRISSLMWTAIPHCWRRGIFGQQPKR